MFQGKRDEIKPRRLIAHQQQTIIAIAHIK